MDTCPRCGGEQCFPADVKCPTAHLGKGQVFAVAGTLTRPLAAEVCAACGYTELVTADAGTLYGAWRNEQARKKRRLRPVK